MRLQIADSLDHVDSGDWNALDHAGVPFLRHEFLAALERSGCVSRDTGWEPRHLLAWDPAPGGGETLAGAVPLYRKTHSYGEYVFDWAWANAYARQGLAYYPKLVSCIPFTPATGPRLLLSAGAAPETAEALVREAVALVPREGASSLHWLFLPRGETAQLERQGHLRRTGYQFHWHNDGYQDFEDFLAGFSARKRKNIKRERRRVREAGIQISVLQGGEIGRRHWETFYRCYRATIQRHGAIPYLNPAFFQEIGSTLPENIVLILARRHGEEVAGALYFQGRAGLYGRYWGGLRRFDGLHFELCYYQAIEYCIRRRLPRFEAGAQGEHKLSRGLLPANTYSCHRLERPEFQQAVAEFLGREANGLDLYIGELNEHAPFKARGNA